MMTNLPRVVEAVWTVRQEVPVALAVPVVLEQGAEVAASVAKARHYPSR